LTLAREADLKLKIKRTKGLLARRNGTLENAKKAVSNFRMETMAKSALFQSLPEIMTDLSHLAAFSMALKPSQIQCLLEIILEAGAYQITGAGREDSWLIWNNGRDDRAKYYYAQENFRVWDYKERFVQERSVIPRFKVINFAKNQQLTLNIGDHTFTYGIVP
jgi:hypothetical protein